MMQVVTNSSQGNYQTCIAVKWEKIPPPCVANVFLWSSRISAARFCIGWWCGQHLHHAFGIWTPLNNIKVPFLWWNDNEKCMKKWQNSWTVNIFWMSDGIDEIMHRSASTKDDEQFNLHSVKNQWFGNQLPLLWWFLKRQHFEANYALHSNDFEEVNFNVEDAAKAREEGLPSLSRSSRILVNQTFKSRAKRQ